MVERVAQATFWTNERSKAKPIPSWIAFDTRLKIAVPFISQPDLTIRSSEKRSLLTSCSAVVNVDGKRLINAGQMDHVPVVVV